MKFKVLFLLFITSINSFGQNWKEIPKSMILYSSFTTENNSSDFKYVYFKKGNSLITVEKYLSEDFIKLLTSNPEVFDDIYKVAYRIVEKSELINWGHLDSVIKDIEFKDSVIITDRNFVNGVNEFIWVLTNGTDLEPCYINLVFEKNKAKGESKYMASIKSHCQI